MLKKKEFGEAIGKAIDLMIERGHVASRADIARHFKIKPPSLVDWVKKGSIEKDKLHELWRFFSKVAGPEHWGMTNGEWPTELSFKQQSATPAPTVNEPKTPKFKSVRDERIEAIVAALDQIDDFGIVAMLEHAKYITKEYPAIKKTPSSSP